MKSGMSTAPRPALRYRTKSEEDTAFQDFLNESLTSVSADENDAANVNVLKEPTASAGISRGNRNIEGSKFLKSTLKRSPDIDQPKYIAGNVSISSSNAPGSQTLSEMRDKIQFFSELEKDGTLDYSELNKQLNSTQLEGNDEKDKRLPSTAGGTSLKFANTLEEYEALQAALKEVGLANEDDDVTSSISSVGREESRDDSRNVSRTVEDILKEAKHVERRWRESLDGGGEDEGSDMSESTGELLNTSQPVPRPRSRTKQPIDDVERKDDNKDNHDESYTSEFLTESDDDESSAQETQEKAPEKPHVTPPVITEPHGDDISFPPNTDTMIMDVSDRIEVVEENDNNSDDDLEPKTAVLVDIDVDDDSEPERSLTPVKKPHVTFKAEELTSTVSLQQPGLTLGKWGEGGVRVDSKTYSLSELLEDRGGVDEEEEVNVSHYGRKPAWVGGTRSLIAYSKKLSPSREDVNRSPTRKYLHVASSGYGKEWIPPKGGGERSGRIIRSGVGVRKRANSLSGGVSQVELNREREANQRLQHRIENLEKSFLAEVAKVKETYEADMKIMQFSLRKSKTDLENTREENVKLSKQIESMRVDRQKYDKERKEELAKVKNQLRKTERDTKERNLMKGVGSNRDITRMNEEMERLGHELREVISEKEKQFEQFKNINETMKDMKKKEEKYQREICELKLEIKSGRNHSKVRQNHSNLPLYQTKSRSPDLVAAESGRVQQLSLELEEIKREREMEKKKYESELNLMKETMTLLRQNNGKHMMGEATTRSYKQDDVQSKVNKLEKELRGLKREMENRETSYGGGVERERLVVEKGALEHELHLVKVERDQYKMLSEASEVKLVASKREYYEEMAYKINQLEQAYKKQLSAHGIVEMSAKIGELQGTISHLQNKLSDAEREIQARHWVRETAPPPTSSKHEGNRLKGVENTAGVCKHGDLLSRISHLENELARRDNELKRVSEVRLSHNEQESLALYRQVEEFREELSHIMRSVQQRSRLNNP